MGRTLGHLLISSASRNIDIKSEAKESTRHASQSSIESVTFFKVATLLGWQGQMEKCFFLCGKLKVLTYCFPFLFFVSHLQTMSSQEVL